MSWNEEMDRDMDTHPEWFGMALDDHGNPAPKSEPSPDWAAGLVVEEAVCNDKHGRSMKPHRHLTLPKEG